MARGAPRACIRPVLAMRRADGAVLAAVEHLTLLVECNRRACAPAAGDGRVGNAAVQSPLL